MVSTQHISLTEALDVDQVKNLGAKLAGLPNPETFRNTVEDDLWHTFTGAADPGDSIKYKDLPERSKAVIGYAEGSEIPWWLRSFAWSATSHGEEITLAMTDSEDTLSQFEEFDPQDTTIHKPELQTGTNAPEEEIMSALEAFQDLYEAFPDQVTTETGVAETALPEQVFEIEEGVVRTTNACKTWFNNLLHLSPPINDVLTAVLMTDVGVEQEAFQNIVSQDVLDRLNDVGLAGNRVSNSDYRTALRDILALSGVFDLLVPQASEFDDLGGLEGMFYDVWAQNFAGDQDDAGEWLAKASMYRPEELETGMQGAFAESAFELPVRLKRGKIVYTTLRYSPSESRYYRSDQGKRKEIDSLMESYGFLE